MRSKIIKVSSPAVGTPVIVPIPAGAGVVRVVHDFGGSGSGTVEYTYDTEDSAVANTPFAWLSGYAASVADKSDYTLPAQATAVKLTSTTAVQRFILVGEHYAG